VAALAVRLRRRTLQKIASSSTAGLICRCGRLCFPLPAPIEGQAGEDEEQADGGAAWADEPEIDGEHERAEDEEAGHPGIAPAAIRAFESGF